MSSNFFGFLGKKDKDKDQKQVTPAPPAPPNSAAPSMPTPGGKPALVPVAAKPPGQQNYTTQPLVLPKSNDSGLRAVKPTGVGKSTQRIVLPGRGSARMDTSSSNNQSPTPPQQQVEGSVSLPLGMIIRIMPEGLCSISPDQIENSPEASSEFSLPLQLIVPQLPSGKILLTIQDILPHVPRDLFAQDEVLNPYLPTVLSLPLMDVVMRIPPDVMSLRPDQKGVDAAVLNMADPFTEQLLREAAREAAQAKLAAENAAPAPIEPRPLPSTKIIEESEVKSKEQFVPQDSSASSTPPAIRVTPPTKATNRIPTRPKSQILPRASSPASLKPVVPPPPTPVPPVVAPPPIVAPEVETAASLPPESIYPAEEAVPEATPVAIEEPVESSEADTLKKLAMEASAQLEQVQTEEPEPTPESEPVPEPVASNIQEPEEPTPVIESAPPILVSAPEPKPQAFPSPVVPVPQEPATLPPAPVSWPTPVPRPPAIAAQKSVPQPPAPIPAPVSVPKLAETISSHKITEPVPSAAPVPPKIVPTVPPAQESSPNVDLNSCTVEQLLLVPGCPRTIAEAIVRFREKNGDYQKLEDLLLVPGMTAVLFALLTGQSDPRPPVRTLNELLGFPAGQKISLKDVCDRVASWPHITGIVLGHSTGLPMVGHVPVPFESTTIMAFAPKIFGMVNQSYKQFAGEETTEIIFPSKGTSFHLFHTTELYAVVLSNKRSLPKGQAKLLRQIIAEIVRQEKNKI